MSQVAYRFGAVEVRPAERQILVEGKPAAVGSRAFDLLLALIDQRDRVIGKNELLDRVWPGLIVEENNLQVQVSTLRKILGSQSIATLPGRGYRFTLPLDGDVPGPSCPLPGHRHNLPAELNAFVGREREIAQAEEAIVNARLVTLTGVGGTGKSRLSLQVAARLTQAYPDGVWLVELSPVSDAERVAQAVAFVLGVKEEAGKPVMDALVRFVRDKRLVLVLDNCEHLVGACADLARRLLLAGPGLKILASSREPLHVTGEVRLPVPALALETEALRLFVERAAAVKPGFALDDSNRAHVQSICTRLDGIPLAIELAAARVPTLTLERIDALLDDMLRSLGRGDRAAPARQQTLRASIDWSYELLLLPERVMLRRLAVFAGGWTLESAEAVCAGKHVEPDDVVDLLTQLVEKSLVEIDGRGERYRLLDTVRQYALQLLEASGEVAAVRGRHLEHFVALAEKGRAGIAGAHAGVWLARLDLERENFLSAHRWCDKAEGGPGLGLRLTRALRAYWLNRGYVGLGLGVTIEALARTRPDERTPERCRVLFDAGQIACYMGRYAEAAPYLEESLAIARELGDSYRAAAALQPLSTARLGLGDASAARAHAEEAVAILRTDSKPNELAGALNTVGQYHRVRGEIERAEAAYREALGVIRETENLETMAIMLLNLAITAVLRGDGGGARTLLLQVIEIEDRIASTHATQSVLEVCAGLAARGEEWSLAGRYYGAAEAMAAQTGLHRDPADEAFLHPFVEAARAALAGRYAESEAAGRALSHVEALAEARAWLAREVMDSPTRR